MRIFPLLFAPFLYSESRRFCKSISLPISATDSEGGNAMRIGQGYDIHRLVEGRKLILGGVLLPFHKGLLGHSDADALIHAVIDALFGACALGDIGSHFPDSDPTYKDSDSLELLRKTAACVRENGFVVVNIDSTVVIEQPKLAPYILKMRGNIAAAVGIDISSVSIKAKTREKMGDVGKGEAVEAYCAVLIEKKHE